MKSLLLRFARNELGAAAIEYGLLAALIAVVIIGAAQTVGTNLKTTLNSVGNALTSSGAGAS